MIEKNKKAALYLRSSKDRSDVSIDAQRRTLTKLAKEKGILIVHEYADPVVSAKDERRPEFQKLLVDLRSPSRSWNTLILLDSSRLSRRQYFAPIFKHELSKRGVDIIFSKIPDVDPITKIVLEGTFETMDVVHSMLSKEKGLAGMAENVNQGFRAGGRAPRGYKLKHVATGTMREGKPVEKSTLEPNNEAPAVKRYLKARAQDVPRAKAKADSAIKASNSSLVDLEWNALTYAGNTIWNVRNEFVAGQGYKNGSKRKPRSQWLINKKTHKALISNEEAEHLVSQLETSNANINRAKAKAAGSKYLLSGLLKSPDGRNWDGDGKNYRVRTKAGLKGRYVNREKIERPIIAQFIADMKSKSFLNALLKKVQLCNTIEPPPELGEATKQLNDINKRISKTMDFASELEDPAPALRKINELEKTRKVVANEITTLEREYKAQSSLAHITEDDLKQSLNNLAEGMLDPSKEAISPFVERIELDPVSLKANIHYRISVVDRLNMASPRLGVDNPALTYIRNMLLKQAA